MSRKRPWPLCYRVDGNLSIQRITKITFRQKGLQLLIQMLIKSDSLSKYTVSAPPPTTTTLTRTVLCIHAHDLLWKLFTQLLLYTVTQNSKTSAMPSCTHRSLTHWLGTDPEIDSNQSPGSFTLFVFIHCYAPPEHWQWWFSISWKDLLYMFVYKSIRNVNW